MKKELKEKALKLFAEGGLEAALLGMADHDVRTSTVERWCFPDLNEEAKRRAKERHDKLKDDPEYKEKRRLAAQKRRQTDESKAYFTDHYNKTIDKRKEVSKQHRADNIEQYTQRSKEYYQTHKEVYVKSRKKSKQKNQERELRRYHEDPFTNLKQQLRMSLNRALKSQGLKKTYSAEKYLGCTIVEFKTYLESLFEEGMDWSNRSAWHIDHKLPLTLIHDGYTLEQLCHYKNLQPLWKEKNLQKGNSLEYPLIFSDDILSKEKEYYQTSDGTYDLKPPHNKLVLHNQYHFYEKERELLQDANIRQKLLENRCKYLGKCEEDLTPQQILLGFRISGIHKGFSHFNPLWFKKVIQTYNLESVYDPCGGWGHRLLGTLRTNVKYIYNDFDPRTCAGVKKIAEFCGSDMEIHNQKAEEFIPPPTQAIFTCPPYFNKECYNGKMFPDYENFTTWWDQVVSCCTQNNPQYFGFVIDKENEEMIQAPFKDNKLLERTVLSKSLLPLIGKAYSYEVLYVFGLR